MIQTLVVVLIFITAVAYLARMVYRSFQSDTGCSTGCGKCNAVDFSKIEKQLKEKGI